MNKNMSSLRRVALLVVALVASSLSLVTVASSPARAATTYDTFAQVGANYSWVTYGATVTVKGRVGYDNGGQATYVAAGTATLQQLAYGTSTWRPVSSKAIVPGTGDLTWSVRPTNTTQYRVVYVGGSYGDKTWNGSTSPVVKVGVARSVTDKFAKRSGVFKGKVSPSYKKKRVIVQKTTCNPGISDNCRWKTFKKLRTDKKSAWSIKLRYTRTKTYYRVVVKPSNGYVTSYSKHYVSLVRY